MITSLPKAELHVHLECSISPKQARILAEKNKINISDDAFDADGNYQYDSFAQFLELTELVGQCLKYDRDYYDITWEYLGAVDVHLSSIMVAASEMKAVKL